MTATPAMQEKPSAKSPSASNGPCIIAINPKAIHNMTTTGFTRGTPVITTALGGDFSKNSIEFQFWISAAWFAESSGILSSSFPAFRRVQFHRHRLSQKPCGTAQIVILSPGWFVAQTSGIFCHMLCEICLFHRYD
jgi:hypothetical protein